MNRILLIEDDELCRRGLAAAMTDGGWRVKALLSGEQCCSVAAQFKPDLVVVDWLLASGLDGLEIARQLRGVRPELPIVLITGFIFSDEESAALAGVVDKILRKPFRLMQFIDTVREVLASREPSPRQTCNLTTEREP